MASRLVNVRLDGDRARKARRLQAKGITLSDVVREAIDARYAEAASTSAVDIRALARRIFDEHPDPARAKGRGYDVHDAASGRAAIRRRLARKRRG